MTNDIIDVIVQGNWQISYVFLQIAILDTTFTLSKVVLNHKIAEKLALEADHLFYMIFCDSAFEPFEVTAYEEVWWDSKKPYITFFDKSCTVFQEKLDQEVNEKIKNLKVSKKKVIVEVMDINWIYSDGKNFNQIIPSLSDIIQEKLSFGDSTFMKSLLATFWPTQ